MRWGLVFIVGLDLFFQTVFRFYNFGLENHGVSFGLVPKIGLVVSIVALAILTFMADKKRVYFWLILLGGGGNIVSRLVWGSVWDYICLPLLPFCFNLSDVLISLGVVSYILGVSGNRDSLRRQRDTGNQ